MDAMSLSTVHYARCIQTLESSLVLLRQAQEGSLEYEIFRNAVVKGFELTLETAGKLLRRALKEYTSSPRAVDELSYKDVMRQAAQHGLMSTGAVTRWFAVRDYDEENSEETLKLLPGFIDDARVLEAALREKLGDAVA
jgi:hypothetical protein